MTKSVNIVCKYNASKYHSASTETITVPQSWYDYAVKFDELEYEMNNANEDDYIAAEHAYIQHTENSPVEYGSEMHDDFTEFLDAFWAANDYFVEVN